MKELPIRKPNRLKDFDYAKGGAYFITFCVESRKNILSHIVNTANDRPPTVQLTQYGKIADQAIRALPLHYEGIQADPFVIMPNHIHLILLLPPNNEQTKFAPTVSRVIQQLKGVITKQIGESVWQRSFYDHVIRNEKDYLSKCRYIAENPAKWPEDALNMDSL